MTLTEARALIADALNTAALGFDVRPKPIKSPKVRDGWVLVERLVPGEFGRSVDADLSVVLLVGSATDFSAAEDALDLAPQLINILSVLPVSGLSVEPATVPTAGSAFLALIVTLNMEL